MCRLAAYLGPERPLSEVVIDPSHSLIAQSQIASEAKLSVNGDGFGIAWYDTKAEPGLFKDVLPAWSDGNLLTLCEHISAPLFLAHVRASTEGETARELPPVHPWLLELHAQWPDRVLYGVAPPLGGASARCALRTPPGEHGL